MHWIHRAHEGRLGTRQSSHTVYLDPNSLSSPHGLDKSRARLLTAGLTHPSATGRKPSVPLHRGTEGGCETDCNLRTPLLLKVLRASRSNCTLLDARDKNLSSSSSFHLRQLPLSSGVSHFTPFYSPLLPSAVSLSIVFPSIITQDCHPSIPLFTTQRALTAHPISTQNRLRIPILVLSSSTNSIHPVTHPAKCVRTACLFHLSSSQGSIATCSL